MFAILKSGSRPGPFRYLAIAAIAIAMIFLTKRVFPGATKGGRDDFLGTISVQSARFKTPGEFRAGDPYRLILEPKGDVYYYVFKVDPNGGLIALFPTTVTPVENPIESPVALPSEDSAFIMENTLGTHLVFAIASGSPLDEFEDAFDEDFLDDLKKLPHSQFSDELKERVHRFYTSGAFVTFQAIDIEVLAH